MYSQAPMRASCQHDYYFCIAWLHCNCLTHVTRYFVSKVGIIIFHSLQLPNFTKLVYIIAKPKRVFVTFSRMETAFFIIRHTVFVNEYMMCRSAQSFYFLRNWYHRPIPMDRSSTNRPRVGVTKPIFPVPLFSTFSVIVKTNASYWISRLYLIGVAAAQLRWHLSNMNMIQGI